MRKIKYNIKPSKKFKKDLKLAIKRGLKIEDLDKVVNMLANGEELPPEYKNHQLKGKYTGCSECHINPDWLLIYRINNDILEITLTHTGTHSDLFR
jgi:mRNA interferase YafQ